MSRGRVVILAENDYQDMEVWYPLYRLREAGYTTVVVGPRAQTYTSKHGYPVHAEKAASEVRAGEFDGIVIPGGWAPDRLRMDPAVVALVRDIFRAGKVVASICHGGWLLASAGIVTGKRVTSYVAIRDDLVHAGGAWEDAEVVRDGNLITSRKPDDLPAFLRETLRALEGS